MKFGKLKEKSYTKCGGEIISRSFSNKSKFSLSLERQPEILQICFILCPNRGPPKYIKLRCLKLSFVLYKAFSKNKKSSL